MGRTTVDGCLLAGVGSNLGKNTFSLTYFGIGMQTGSQTPTYFAASKKLSLQMSRKPEDNEPASKENRQIDPRGNGGEPPL